MEDINPIRRWFAEWRGRWMNIAGSAILRLGDAAGESKLSIRNSDDQEVFFFKSNGTSNIEPVEGEEGEALLRGGSRSLIGDLTVASGVKVDGVDISAFKGDTETWQSNHVNVGADPHALYARKQSVNYVSGAAGYKIDPTSGDAEFGNLRARGEFLSSVFRVNEISANAGTMGVYYSASTVYERFQTPSAVAGTVNAKIRNSSPTSVDAMFAKNDRLQIKSWNGTALVGAWFTIDDDPAAGTGYSTYKLKLEDGSTSAYVEAGTAVVNWGVSGYGAITLSADGTIGSSPNLSVLSHSGSPWTTTTLRARLGNLKNSYGYGSSNVYGFAAGEDSGTFVSVDAVNGFRVVRGSTTRFQVDKNGNLSINNSGGSPVIEMNSSGNASVSGTLSAGTAKISSTGFSVDINTGVKGTAWGLSNGYRFSGTTTAEFIGLYASQSDTLQDSVELLNKGNYGKRSIVIQSELTDDFPSGSGAEIILSAIKLGSENYLSVSNVNVKVMADFAVYDKFTVAKLTGNTAVSGTLSVTGATTLAELSATTGTFSSTLSATGNFAINTSKFTVAALTGNTVVAGTFNATGATTLAALSATTGTFSSTLSATGNFAVNTNKFTVAASTGNTVVAGTLNVTGATTLAALNATTGAFSGAVSGTGGTFTGGVTATGTFQSQLVIGAASSAGSVAFNRGSNGATTAWIGWATATDAANFEFKQTGGGAYYTWAVNTGSGAAEVMRLTSAGRLGIGNNSPGYLLDVSGDVNSTGVYRKGGTQVVSSRVTGWAAATGTATRTTFATSTVTTAQLAERVKALIDDLVAHGLIGA